MDDHDDETKDASIRSSEYSPERGPGVIPFQQSVTRTTVFGGAKQVDIPQHKPLPADREKDKRSGLTEEEHYEQAEASAFHSEKPPERSKEAMQQTLQAAGTAKRDPRRDIVKADLAINNAVETIHVQRELLHAVMVDINQAHLEHTRRLDDIDLQLEKLSGLLLDWKQQVVE